MKTIWVLFESASYQALVFGLSGGLFTYFVYRLTDAVAFGARPGFIFWILIGLVVAVYKLAIANREFERQSVYTSH